MLKKMEVHSVVFVKSFSQTNQPTAQQTDTAKTQLKQTNNQENVKKC